MLSIEAKIEENKTMIMSIRQDLRGLMSTLERESKKLKERIDTDSVEEETCSFGSVYGSMSGAITSAIRLEQEHDSLIREIRFLEDIKKAQL